jgi:hypothetical protein
MNKTQNFPKSFLLYLTNWNEILQNKHKSHFAHFVRHKFHIELN